MTNELDPRIHLLRKEVTQEVRREIIYALKHWLMNPAGTSWSIEDAWAKIKSENLTIYLRHAGFDGRTPKFSVRYKRRWLSGKVLKRAIQMRFGAKLRVHFPDRVLMEVTRKYQDGKLFWTKTGLKRISDAVQHIQSNPEHCEVRRLGANSYEVRESAIHGVKVIGRITGANDLIVEDFSFVSSPTGQGALKT